VRLALTATLLLPLATGVTLQSQALPAPAGSAAAVESLSDELAAAVVRLPLAGLLGAALALRPRRRGTPERSMPVIETQIVLAIVGALIMLVVGASLARAFGIVGAANLIRYRAKIDDPKDAVVMLAALSVGLASGVGLYGLATVGTLFVCVTLWAIESFEPAERKSFELTVTAKGKAGELRPGIEGVLARFKATAELRGAADDAVTYFVSAPATLPLDRVSNALERLASDDTLAVEWDEKKARKPS
jgi:hypothetical protein